MKFGKAFKQIREEQGLSRSAVAAEIRCTPSALSKIENGKTMPKWSTINKFCAFAHIPPAYFFQKATDLEDYICP